ADWICRRTPARGGEILLSDFEFVEESIFKNIGFVDIDLPPQIGSVVSDIADLENGVARQLALPPDVPTLHVSGFEVRAVIGNVVAGRNRQWIIRSGWWNARRQSRIAEKNRTRRPEI